MLTIGFVIARIGGIDGVALETEKWIHVLSRLGHRVRVLAGALEGEVPGAALEPRLALDHPVEVGIQRDAFPAALGGVVPPPGEGAAREAELLRRIERSAAAIAASIRRWVAAEGVTCLVPENACALPCHLGMGAAIEQVVREDGLWAVTHDHDFWWERPGRYDTPHAGVAALVRRCFPLVAPRVRHAVINSAAREALARRFGVGDAVVVPNVMDFDAPFGARDAYNADLPAALGLAPDDVLLFQVTRIVARKGIHTAIDLVHRLGDPRVKLVLTGTAVDDTDGYLPRLRAQVARLGLERQVRFAGDRFDNQRRTAPDGEKIYALSDAYAHAAAVTYFSTYEGFGNAFVEAVCAGVPVLVNDYEPVFWPDIGSLGFDVVMIRDGQLTDQAVARTRVLLSDPARRAAAVATNRELGRRYFSLDALARLLGPLFRG